MSQVLLHGQYILGPKVKGRRSPGIGEAILWMSLGEAKIIHRGESQTEREVLLAKAKQMVQTTIDRRG